MKTLIIILGMHRSGTSVVAQICQSMGAYLGKEKELMIATEDNLDGYFENIEIANIDSEILHICGREWYSTEPLKVDYNNLQIVKAIAKLKRCVQRLIEKEEFVAIKDPRISILLPVWEKALCELKIAIKYIWVFRNPMDVMESLKRRDGYSKKHCLTLWCYYNICIFKYLEEKNYLLINYKDVMEKTQIFNELGLFLNRTIDDREKKILNCIVKDSYCHSRYPDYRIQMEQDRLMSDIYYMLLEKKKKTTLDWEKIYFEREKKRRKIYIDYEILVNYKKLETMEVIIYGAGEFGKQAAEMLQQLGIIKYNFCDRDIYKQGSKIMEGYIFSISEIEKRENLLIIIAIENDEIKKEIEQTLKHIKGVRFFSFFALKAVWKYWGKDYTSIESEVERKTLWYKELASRGEIIKNACESPVLIYQNGKVGSLTISQSLKKIDIGNAHIHRFFFKNDVVGELLLGKEYEEFIRESNFFKIKSTEYVKFIKDKIKEKKIITVVRDPVAVDLSTVFQWIGSGESDAFFSKRLKQGISFVQVVSDLMIKIQNRMFDWFDEELREISGINIFDHPFDKKRGYSIISENGVEILVLKVEKLEEITNIIGRFVGCDQLELFDANKGESKAYSHIYQAVKNNIVLPEEYVTHYYKNNSYMDHFYSSEERKSFWMKWMKYDKGECINANSFLGDWEYS